MLLPVGLGLPPDHLRAVHQLFFCLWDHHDGHAADHPGQPYGQICAQQRAVQHPAALRK